MSCVKTRDVGRSRAGSWFVVDELASGVQTIALRTIEPWYAAAGGAPKTGRIGSVNTTQRFGSDDRVSFRRVVPHTEDEGDDDGDDDAQAVIQPASLLGQAALGERAGKRARCVQVLGGKELQLPPRCASFAGYSLQAGVGFKASDRAGLERLCRYILRPPLADGPAGPSPAPRGRQRRGRAQACARNGERVFRVPATR